MKLATTKEVRCINCGANNRIDAAKLSDSLQAICGKCRQPLREEVAKPTIATDANFSSTVERASLPVLLDLWAAWCGPCRQLAPVIDQLALELSGRVKVAKLNIDENPHTAARFGIRSIPTLLVLRNGREVDRIVGAQPKEEILRKLKSLGY